MVDWPTSLPGFLSGIGERKGKTKARSEVDVGPAIMRQRYTAPVRNLDLPMIMSNDQKIIFEAFYEDDLQMGTLSFNWIDPVTMATVVMRFREEEGPQWNGSGAYDADPDADVRTWSATFAMEILP